MAINKRSALRHVPFVVWRHYIIYEIILKRLTYNANFIAAWSKCGRGRPT